MNCLFCQRKTELYGVTKDASDIYVEWELYSCRACNASFDFMVNIGQTVYYSFVIENYEALFDLSQNIFYVSYKNGGNNIVMLRFVPNNITPTNLLKKLPTLKVFG